MTFTSLFDAERSRSLDAAEVFDAIEHASRALAESRDRDSPRALEIAVRLLDAKRVGQIPEGCTDAVEYLAEECGLYPYVLGTSFSLLTNTILEAHSVQLREKIYLHAKQMQVLLWLLHGDNVILSAPTSFGKTLLVDAFIARSAPRTVVMIMPTIALIDETRRRLTRTFGDKYDVVTTVTDAHDSDRATIFVLTQERFLQRAPLDRIDFLFVDEFYKLDPKRDDSRFETLNLALYQALPKAGSVFMAGPHIRSIELGPKWAGSFRFVRTDYKTVTVNVIDRSRGGDRLELFLQDLRSVRSGENSLVFCATPAGAESLQEQILSTGLSYRTTVSGALGQWLRDNYHPNWSLAAGVAEGVAVHHGRLPRALGQLFIRLFDRGALRVLLCTSTLIEGVNTSAANVFIFDKAINRTDFDFFSFANIRGRVGRMMRHFIGNAYLYHEPPSEIETRVDVPVLADPGSSTEFILANVNSDDLSDAGRARQQELPFDTGLPAELIKKHGAVGVPVLQDLVASVQEILSVRPHDLLWAGIPQKEQRQVLAELALKVAHARGERTGIHTARQVSWAWSQLAACRTLSAFLKWFAKTFGAEDASKGLDLAFQFLQACEFAFPRAVSVVEAIVSAAAPSAGVTYGAFMVNLEAWFRPPWMKQLDEAGIPLPLVEKLRPHMGSPSSFKHALRNLSSINLQDPQLRLDEVERLILGFARGDDDAT
jgi:hypothetical protein